MRYFAAVIVGVVVSSALLAEDQPSATKAAVPGVEAQGKAAALIKDLFKDEYARRDPASKLSLATKLLDLSKEARQDEVKCFVLLSESSRLALQAGDAITAFRAIDSLAEGYAIDPLGMRLAALSGLTSTARSAASIKDISEKAPRIIRDAISGDLYEAAVRAASDVLKLAQKAQDGALAVRAKQLKDEAQALGREYAKLEAERKTLAEKPDDPLANLALGKFYCFLKDDWEKGLRMLARSEDHDLKPLAEMEISGNTRAFTKVNVAAWWADLSARQSGQARKAMQERAVKWYERALPDLSGLGREAALKKIAALLFGGAQVWETRSGDQGLALGGEGVNVTKQFTVEFWFATTASSGVLLTKRHEDQDGSLTLSLESGCPVVIGDAPFYRIDGQSSAHSNDGKWHHLAAVESEGLVNLYLDGNAVAKLRTRPGFSSKSPWVLGFHRSWKYGALDARFAKIRFSKIARYAGPFDPLMDYASDKDTLLLK